MSAAAEPDLRALFKAVERETGIVNTPPSENTVEPVLSSHPQGMTGWSLNKS